MSGVTEFTVAQIRDGFRAGDFSAREVAEAFNANVAAARALNAFIVETPDHALAAADQADKDRVAGTLKPLSGVPIGMKDLFCTLGIQTTAASHMLEGFKPTYESTVSQKLWDAGAGMLGKLNLDQFAMGSSNETSYFGNVISPWRRSDGGNAALAPGGSSGGSSSAIAARLCPAATGTDTGGSIRQPAAFTGISGIKPTYGRCSRWGIIAFASSLDQAGPMARTVRDCAIMLESMAGFDPKDSTSLARPVPAWEGGLSSDLKGKKVGIPKEYRVDGLDADVARVWDDGIAWLKMPARRSSRSRCHTANMRCRPITSSLRPKPRPISRAMTACAMVCVIFRTAPTCRTCMPRRAPRASARRSSAASSSAPMCFRPAFTTPIIPRRRRSAR